MFRSLFPILTVADVERSLGFYRDLLRGTVEHAFPDDGPPVYVSVHVGGSPLGIGLDDGTAPAGVPRTALWVYVDDCDRAVEHLAAAGVPVLEPPTDQPWGERVARVQDPDGTVVVLGQAATPPAEPEGPTGLS
ncbi:bleomycin resistance protein [Cellulosimicrobium sp. BIT-GX5]|uniref:Bleomycin resistance protein n=1 Tax=Cellulosimicrobium composti TaxID=2672572 RepID=A0A6N7ZMW7_9MICO|nr:glyoxalase superfamily protein [Cellulosimicrobium composti]MTG90528.1 bleomycin resistance protein [Cellulosimicrobium composti]